MLLPFFQHNLSIKNISAEEFNQCILLFDASAIEINHFNLPNILSAFELNIINRRKTQKAKQEYLATRVLLKYLVKLSSPTFNQLKPNQISSEFDEPSSKLLLKIANTDIQISSCLSHSNGLVGAAINPQSRDFGFDIEKINLKRPFAKLASHYYHPQELALINAHESPSAEYFFRIWTLKEAFAKATSQPIAKLLSPNIFTELSNVNLKAVSTQYNDFDISVVSESANEWYCVVINDLEELIQLL